MTSAVDDRVPVDGPDTTGRTATDDADKLPFWRRPRRLRRQIASTLVVSALVAVAVFGALNFVAADRLLRDGSRSQLVSVGESRARSIELGVNRLLNGVATIANDLGVTTAVDDFSRAYADARTARLDPDQEAQLEDFYRTRVVDPLNEADLLDRTVTVDQLLPETNAGRYLQFHYTMPEDASERAGATDDSTWADALTQHDTYLRSLADAMGGSDLLLLDPGHTIVYSATKHIDLGTSLVDGPYDESAFARLVTERLGRVRAGEAVVSDFSLYLPSGADQVLFAAATIRSGTEIVGTLALQLPGQALDTITTASGRWDDVGLRDGESYVVSSDLRMQSTSRLWIEDPDAYLDRVDDPDLRHAIEVLESPVGVQTVDTEPVRQAFRGEPFTGSASNYLGQSTFSSSTTVDVPGVEWAVVTDVPASTVRKPLVDYLGNIAVVVLIVVPIAAIIGVVLARRLSRPIAPAVDAAQAIAEGARDLDLPPLGNDEFGDLGRRLARMANMLREQEQALEDEYERKRQLILAVLPPHLVGADGAVASMGDVVDVATVIAVGIETDSSTDVGDELAEQLSYALATAEHLADEQSIERIRVAADRYLFVSGARRSDDGVARAIAFADELMTALQRQSERVGMPLTVHIGLSTGAVATGVLERGSLTFGAWGEPVRRASAISALSRRNEVLVDASTASLFDDDMTRVDGIVDLDDEPMELYTPVRRAVDMAD